MHPLRILFVFLCVALFYYFATTTRNTTKPADPNNFTENRQSTVPEDQSSQNTADALASQENELVAHDYQDLEYFVIPKISIINKSLDEAISCLIEQYESACDATGAQPLDFQHMVQGAPLGSVNLEYSGSFQEILERIALCAGMELFQNRSNLIFKVIPQDLKVTEKSLKVPTDFEHLVGMCPDEYICPSLQHQEGALHRYLVNSMHLSPDIIISYDATDHNLDIKGTRTDLYRINKLVDLTQERKVLRIHTDTDIFSLPNSIKVPTNRRLTPQEFGKIHKQVHNHTRSADQTTPLLISLNRERSTIEKTQEFEAIHVSDNSAYLDWTGYRITTSAEMLGFGLQSYLRVERNVAIQGNKELQIYDQEAETFLLPNESVIVKTHESNGICHYITIRKSISGIVTGRLAIQ